MLPRTLLSKTRILYAIRLSLYNYHFPSQYSTYIPNPKFTSPLLTRSIHLSLPKRDSNESISITFIDRDGQQVPVLGNEGEHLLALAHRYDIDMEGACDASLACTTCHVYIQPEYVSAIPASSEEEEDLLDLAPFLESNSRLGCQVLLSRDMKGMVVTLPKVTRNFYVDGHIPKAH